MQHPNYYERMSEACDVLINQYIYTYQCIYVTANLRNQLFPGIPNPFRELGEFLK